MATSSGNRRAVPGTRRTSVAEARAMGRELLAGISDSPALDTDLLLEHATGLDRIDQLTRPEELMPAVDWARFQELLHRRANGEPVAYIVGRKAFRSVDLIVDPTVLIPRPETELLVEVGLEILAKQGGRRRLLDMGTGSGAVALAIASEIGEDRLREIEIVASDISPDALQVARANRDALGLTGSVDLVESDLFATIEGSFDVILANLPYLRPDQRHPSTAHEPDAALFAGEDGLDLYRRLMPEVVRKLRPRGLIVCEIDPSQSQAMLRIAGDWIPGIAKVLRDIAGRERFLIAGDIDTVRTVVDTWPYGA